MLRRVKLNRDSPENKELKELYEEAFPYEERIPYYDFFDIIDKFGGEFSAYYDGETVIAFVSFLRTKKFIYGAYFAVLKETREKGYGQKIVSDILERYKGDAPLLIECESPYQKKRANPELRKRRHDFYVRNGFKDTGRIVSINGVETSVMTTAKGDVPPEDIEETLKEVQPFYDKFPSLQKGK